ncbi:MAG: hypothetical protein KC777_28560 [Cyanobacteria bacterium HKST-UBA02]|nr:hypothetical protein [Cyanobacteria bacterium HKST-UBA02]
MKSKTLGLASTGILFTAGLALLGLAWKNPLGLTAAWVIVFTTAPLVSIIKTKNWTVTQYVAIVSFIGIITAVAEYISIAPAPIGTALAIDVEAFLVVPFVVTSVFAIPYLFFTERFSKFKTGNLSNSRVALVFAAMCIFASVAPRNVRSCAFLQLSDRLQPVIVAIKQYEKDNSEPPPTLDALVPKYLESLPSTNMGAYRQYRIESDFLIDNRWQLTVPCSTGFCNADEYYYLPTETYSERGGGAVERIGKWAYFHE